MPTYDYRCEACGHKFDIFQRMSEAALVECPACAKPALKRLIGSGAGIIFKGSGFYETDYKRARAGGDGDSKTDSKSDAKPEKTAATTESKSEPKPEPKPEKKPEKAADA
jgi:putative FmdB family regulatory protein